MIAGVVRRNIATIAGNRPYQSLANIMDFSISTMACFVFFVPFVVKSR
jgi:hypothetical protein